MDEPYIFCKDCENLDKGTYKCKVLDIQRGERNGCVKGCHTCKHNVIEISHGIMTSKCWYGGKKPYCIHPTFHKWEKLDDRPSTFEVALVKYLMKRFFNHMNTKNLRERGDFFQDKELQQMFDFWLFKKEPVFYNHLDPNHELSFMEKRLNNMKFGTLKGSALAEIRDVDAERKAAIRDRQKKIGKGTFVDEAGGH